MLVAVPLIDPLVLNFLKNPLSLQHEGGTPGLRGSASYKETTKHAHIGLFRARVHHSRRIIIINFRVGIHDPFMLVYFTAFQNSL